MWSIRFVQSLLKFEARQIVEWQYSIYKILTSYNAVYHEIGFFKSAFVFVLGAITQHHETSISSKSHTYSPFEWETSLGRLIDRRRNSQKPNQDSCYDEIRDDWWNKPKDLDRLNNKRDDCQHTSTGGEFWTRFKFAEIGKMRHTMNFNWCRYCAGWK